MTRGSSGTAVMPRSATSASTTCWPWTTTGTTTDPPRRKEPHHDRRTRTNSMTEAAIEAEPYRARPSTSTGTSPAPAPAVPPHADPEVVRQVDGPGRHAASRSSEWEARRRWLVALHRPAATATSQSFRGCFHTVRPDRIVQTFTWEGMPDGVALETLTFEDLGDGRTRLHAQSLCDSFEARDAWLRSGMETGVNDGYAALDRMLADGAL